jgi:hypothetical protein
MKTPDWNNIPDQTAIEDIGAFLLADLAEGIYSHQAILREYVQNARDAYSDLEQEIGKVTSADRPISIQLEGKNTIAIHDSGIGMDLKRVLCSRWRILFPRRTAKLRQLAKSARFC